MAYCTQEDLLRQIPQKELAELTAEVGEVPDGLVVAEAITKADAEIDSYLGSRYAVPFSPAPARVKALSVDIAIYYLYSRRSLVSAGWRQRYEAALAFLREVAAGRTVVEGVSGEPPGSRREVAEIKSATRVFSRDNLGEW
jgi:phage gp36-like protein